MTERKEALRLLKTYDFQTAYDLFDKFKDRLARDDYEKVYIKIAKDKITRIENRFVMRESDFEEAKKIGFMKQKDFQGRLKLNRDYIKIVPDISYRPIAKTVYLEHEIRYFYNIHYVIESGLFNFKEIKENLNMFYNHQQPR